MSDVIGEMPWHCGEKDCEVGWHRSTYWWHGDGFYSVDAYSDGDHEGVEQKEAEKLLADYEVAWKRYSKDVIATGKDPLQEYRVKSCYTRKARFTVEMRNSICGAVLTKWKRGKGPWTWRAKPPKSLADYLLIEERGGNKLLQPVKCIERDGKGGWKNHYYTLEELLELANEDENVRVTRVKGHYRLHLTLKESVVRKESAVKRDLIKAAKRGK